MSALAALASASGCGAEGGSGSSTLAAPLTGAPAAVWSVTYGPAGATAVAAALGPDGDLVVLAATEDGGGDLAKVDPAGAVVWERAWSADQGTREAPARLVVGGASIVAGASWTADDGTQGAVARTWGADGTPRWTARWIDGPLGDVDLQGGGDAAVTTAGATHCVDGRGAPRWDASTPGTLVRFAPGGDVLVAGTSNDGQADKTTLTRVDARGALGWSYRADDGTSRGLVAGSAPRAIAVDASGTAYVTGYRRSKEDPREPVYAYEMQTVAVAPGGAVVFERDDAVIEDGSIGQAIAFDPTSGRVTVTGVTASANAPGYQQYMTFQYEADGAPRWSRLDAWDGAAGHKRPQAVALAGGVTIVTGTIDAGDHAATVAYDADGSVAWRVRGAGTGAALAVEASAGASPGFYVVGTDAGVVRITRYAPAP